MKRFWEVDGSPRTSDLDSEVDGGREISEREFMYLVQRSDEDGRAFLRIIEEAAQREVDAKKLAKSKVLKKLGLSEAELKVLFDE